MKKEKKEMNFNNFVQSNNVIYEFMHTVKKNDEDILFMFTVEVSLNTNEVTLNNDEDVQMKKSTENNNIVKSTENDDTVLLTEINDIMKLINYNDFMNTTSESFTQMTID